MIAIEKPPLMKSIYLVKKYNLNDSIWAVNIRIGLEPDKEYWNDVYLELINLKIMQN